MILLDQDTPKSISIRRKTSIQATYKTIKKLRELGVLKRGYYERFKKSVCAKTFQPPRFIKDKQNLNLIRLHGQEFNIKLIYISDFYKKLQSRKNLFYVDNNTIRLYRKSIEVYANPHLDFYGEDVQRATSKSIIYWNRLFLKLEDSLKVILVKRENTRIKQVNAHYAEIHNELAEECERKHYKLNIYAKEDSKLWFTIDNSFNLKEAETQHPDTSKLDMTKVKAFFNDLRDNDVMLPSQIQKAIGEVTNNQMMFATNIKSHIGAIQELGKSVKELTKVVKELKRE